MTVICYATMDSLGAISFLRALNSNLEVVSSESSRTSSGSVRLDWHLCLSMANTSPDWLRLDP